MSNNSPIHAIGPRQRRGIEARLRRHAEFMRQYESEGMTREEASQKAFQMVKAGAKPKPYSRNCVASEVPGATCQYPKCDC